MSNKVNLEDWTVLLEQAEQLGYGWNEAHDILVQDEVCPMYETKTQELYHGVGEDYGWSEDSIKIVESYLTTNKLKKVTIV